MLNCLCSLVYVHPNYIRDIALHYLSLPPSSRIPQLFLFMSPIICASCNRNFTHAGYSRHLSMTMRSGCRALYLSCLGLPTASGSPGVSGPEPPLGLASTGPEIHVSGE
jgi:hypothetical protein